MAAADFVDQDGFSPGTLSALEIDTNEFLNGVFSNGVTTSPAQVALESGAPVIAGANSGNLGSIRASSLEKSDVDLSAQFVNLIVAQRAFQANTRTVSVANELLANLVALGQ
ncbi:MAG: hypothetical protein H8E78_09905 [Proteobacteria bacterium]|nr:hypothetical protein [Pseudomonadota bacterium]